MRGYKKNIMENKEPKDIVRQQIKRGAKDQPYDNPKKRVKFSLSDDLPQDAFSSSAEVIQITKKNFPALNNEFDYTQSNQNTGSISLKRDTPKSNAIYEQYHIYIKENPDKIRFDSGQRKHLECKYFAKNHLPNERLFSADGLCKKIPEIKPLSDQQTDLKIADSTKKEKRTNDSSTVDSHNFRIPSTIEVYRLQSIIEEQENEILSLEAKLDSKNGTNSHDECNKKHLITNDDNEIRAITDICNQTEFPYDQSSSRAFSSLTTIPHNKTTEEMTVRKENLSLRNELQEAKDHMELLEFRILEFTEDQKSPQIARCDQFTSTDGWIHNQINTHKISSPNRVSKEYIHDYHSRLQDICNATDHKNSAAHLQSFLELTELFRKYGELEIPTNLDLKPVMDKRPDISEFVESNYIREPIESVCSASLEEEKKVTGDHTNEIDLLKKLESLTNENKELHDIIATLSESHETRTEASGTESEQVHGKTPSISSDLSDTECDVISNLRDVKSGLHNATSLQESGIFEAQCDMADATTQTIEENNEVNCRQTEISHWTQTSLASSMCNEENDIDSIQSPKEFDNFMDVNSQISVEDASAIRIQDMQESDEYLLNEIDDQIILNKTEYDAIVAEDRNLKMRIEELNADNDELTLKCAATEAQLNLAKSKPPTNDEKESMRGAVRVLEEKLQSAEKHSKQFFEEKCEYEEAENDARLMVQRLQSQLDANQDMEALLSASLSQEQEFSRELQNCLRNMQHDEHEDKLKEEKYLREIKVLLEREKYFLSDTHFLKVQYFILIFKVLVREYIKQMWSPKKLQITYNKHDNDSYDNNCDKQLNSYQSGFISQLKLVYDSPLLLGCIFPNIETTIDSENFTQKVNTREEFTDVDIIHHKLNDDLMDCTDSSSEKLFARNSNSLTEREHYYLQHIQILQQEKKNLRNDFETNDGERYEQYVTCRNELDRTGNALEKCESEKCKLLFKIEELQYELQNTKESNDLITQNTIIDYSAICDSLRREKGDINAHYESRLDELKCGRRSLEVKVEELKRKLICIHLELAPYIDDAIRNGPSESDNDDLCHISNLVKSEACLRDKIFELQEKERAYMETISEADKIMSAHVTSYNKRIKELESKLNYKNPILTNVEERLASMKEKISITGSCLESKELEDFFYKLQLEISKLNLPLITNKNKDHFMGISGIEENEDDKPMESDFYEKEDLLQKLLKCTTQNSSLSSQLQEAHEATRKMSEMHQNEHYFRSRVDELESSETCLREDLKKYENCMIQKERKFQDKVNLLKEEISGMKSEVEKAQREMNQAKNSESSVKNELTEMKDLIHSLRSELQESSDENASCDSQHRMEVARLRIQLKIANNQLMEIGGVNSDLKEKLASTELLITEVTKQLKEKVKQHESDVLSLNLKIYQKECSIEDMEAHMQQLKHNEAANELDGLAILPFSGLHHTLREISKGLKDCTKCSDDYAGSINILMEHSETFTQLINGRIANSDSESDGEKSKSCNVVKSSSENENNEMEDDFNYSMSQLADIYPCVPPRPRRDAKLKRKWKRSSNGESILDELQATVKSGRSHGSGRNKTKEMKQNIKSLENKVKVREEELKIADYEVKDLYGKLASETESLQLKQIEITSLQNSMVTFRKEFLTTVEENEKKRLDIDDKHKEELEAMNKVRNDLKNQLTSSMQTVRERNYLIRTIIKIIRTEVCPTRLIDILADILKLVTIPEVNENDCNITSIQSDIEQMMKQISENQQEKVQYLNSESLNRHASSNNHKGLHPAKDCIKHQFFKNYSHSKIPKLKPQYISSLKEKLKSADESSKQCVKTIKSVKQYAGVKSRGLYPMNINNKHNKTEDNDTKCRTKNTELQGTIPDVAKNKSLVESKKSSSNNLDKVITNKRSSIGRRDTKTTVDATLGCNPNITPVPNRCFKRSLKKSLRITSINNDVKKTSLQATCPRILLLTKDRQVHIPRPQNLRITGRVGADGAVIAWNPIESDCISGFQVIVDGRVTQQVRSPKRTKALVYGLPFREGFSISLSAVSTEGRCSIPITVTHKRSTVEKRMDKQDKYICTKTTFTCFSP